MNQAFLIKYSEIGIKGKNRYMFEDALRDRVAEKLKKCEGTFSVQRENGRQRANTIMMRWWASSQNVLASPIYVRSY